MTNEQKRRLAALFGAAASWDVEAEKARHGGDPIPFVVLAARARQKIAVEFGMDTGTEDAEAAEEVVRREIEREAVRDFLESQKRAMRPLCDAFEPCQAAKDEPEMYEPSRTPCGRCGWTKDVHDHVEKYR